VCSVCRDNHRAHSAPPLSTPPSEAPSESWRNLASDAIDTLRASINGNSSAWAKEKLESLRRRGDALVAATVGK
jgi:hypothetical protein